MVSIVCARAPVLKWMFTAWDLAVHFGSQPLWSHPRFSNPPSSTRGRVSRLTSPEWGKEDGKTNSRLAWCRVQFELPYLKGSASSLPKDIFIACGEKRSGNQTWAVDIHNVQSKPSKLYGWPSVAHTIHDFYNSHGNQPQKRLLWAHIKKTFRKHR